MMMMIRRAAVRLTRSLDAVVERYVLAAVAGRHASMQATAA